MLDLETLGALAESDEIDTVIVAFTDHYVWELGYGDFHMVPDIATLRTADWLPGTASRTSSAFV
jgi:hypothetical protein